MNHQPTHRLGPKLGPLRQNPRRHAGGKRCGAAGLPGRGEGPFFRPAECGEQSQVIDIIAGTGRRIGAEITAFQDNIRALTANPSSNSPKSGWSA